jgi:hypothetical protein
MIDQERPDAGLIHSQEDPVLLDVERVRLGEAPGFLEAQCPGTGPVLRPPGIRHASENAPRYSRGHSPRIPTRAGIWCYNRARA